MNKLSERIFKNYKPDFVKLQKYGFTLSKRVYFYSTEIMDGQFALNVRISNSDIDTEVIDTAINEPYMLFLADGASGSFVGAVRAAYEAVMCDIAENCFEKCIFKSKYAQKIIEYVANTYGDELEFLWEKFTDNAIWRRKDNRKWYAALLTVAKDKFGFKTDEKIEILDLRAEPESIAALVDGVGIFGGYHMNKKHWITVLLDGTVPLEDIEKMLDTSYKLAQKG